MSDIREIPNENDSDESMHQDTNEANTRPSGSAPDFDADTAVEYLHWGALLAFVVLTVIAGSGLYSSLNAIIDVWVASEYRPVARSGLNLAVLAVSVGGIATIIRRLYRFQ